MNRDELVNLVRRHQAQVYRYLRYLGAACDVAEDLAQETFVVAFQKHAQGQFRGGEHEAAWLRAVARNLFLGHCRRARTGPIHLDAGALERAEAAWAAEFPPLAGGSDYLAALVQCLQGLPPRERQAVELQYRRGKSRAEIAAACGLTADGVKTLMRRIRAALAACIQRRLRTGGTPCR